MLVSHKNDAVTHAVIGGQETMGMSMVDDAQFMIMMSSTLYSNQKLAVVREVLCNAWDAHIESGLENKPIEISLDSEKLVIKDFGKGIPTDKFGFIFGTYGGSTKKTDQKQTGGHGLGCKSPFAYTDHFEVISCSEGTKTIYTVSKSSGVVEGKPGITPIASFPTEESGLTVTIRIKSGDMQIFNKYIRMVVANGGMQANLNNDLLETLPFDKADLGFLITNKTVSEINTSSIYIRYGNVIYPVEKHESYDTEYKKACQILEGLHINYWVGRYNLILQAEPDTISVTPSRESLSMQARTIDSLTKLFKQFINNIENFLDHGIDFAKSYWQQF